MGFQTSNPKTLSTSWASVPASEYQGPPDNWIADLERSLTILWSGKQSKDECTKRFWLELRIIRWPYLGSFENCQSISSCRRESRERLGSTRTFSLLFRVLSSISLSERLPSSPKYNDEVYFVPLVGMQCDCPRNLFNVVRVSAIARMRFLYNRLIR